MLTVLLMFVEGAPGSTAGGIKATTFHVILFATFSYIVGNEDVNLLGLRIPESDTRFKEKDIVVVMGKNSDLKALQDMA